MERATDACNPSPKNLSSNKNARTPFLTPCRRLGLARKSPAPAGSLHANRCSPIPISPYKSPVNVIQEICSDTVHNENDSIRNQVTPSRNIRKLQRLPLPKRLKISHTAQHCIEGDQNSTTSNEPQSSVVQVKMSCIESTKELSIHKCTPCTEAETEVMIPVGNITEEMIMELHMRIKKKEEKLKDLKLAQIYKKKHDVNTLQNLIKTWLEGCQTALQELQSALLMQGHQLSMEEMLDQLNIPHDLIKYRADFEDFE